LDVLLLCSDGLTRMVTEPEIAGTLQAETDPVRAAEKLVGLANERGGPDNITVVIARLEKESRGWFFVVRRGTPKIKVQMVALEEIEMPKLSLMFNNKIVKEVSVGSRP